MVVLGVLPFSLLTFLSVKICRAIRQQSYNVTDASAEEFTNNYQVRRRDYENSMAKVLIAIVVVFLICHGLRTFVQILLGACELSGQCGGMEWHPILLSFANFFIILNSSINLVIYCFVCRSFRNRCSKTVKNCVDVIALQDVWRTDVQASNSLIV